MTERGDQFIDQAEEFMFEYVKKRGSEAVKKLLTGQFKDVEDFINQVQEVNRWIYFIACDNKEARRDYEYHAFIDQDGQFVLIQGRDLKDGK